MELAIQVCAFEIPLYLRHYAGQTHVIDALVQYYWIKQGALRVGMCAMVLSLAYHATASLGARTIARLCLIGGAILYAAVTLALNYNAHAPRIGEWITCWCRDLNRCSAVLNLVVWALLIASHKKDHCLLMVTGAVGIFLWQTCRQPPAGWAKEA